MTSKPDPKEVLGLLKRQYRRAPETALAYRSPLQLLVATILSAQCTDERVNKVTPALFLRYDSANGFAAASTAELEQLVRSTGFFHNKAKHIKAAATMIDSDYGGRVPDTMEGLLLLPGVARKTANIVLTAAYGRIEGIAVDTHVRRLSQRIGLAVGDKPGQIERQLMKEFKKADWPQINRLLVAHGRAVCKARWPNCGICVLRHICQKKDVQHLTTGYKRLRT